MIILDTSFIVSYYNLADDNHNGALEIMNKILKGNLNVCISDFIFSECATVLLAKLKDLNKVVEICEKIKKIDIIRVDENLFEETWDIFKKQEKAKLSFIDCSIIALSKLKEIEKVATFDQELMKLKEIDILQ